MRSAPNAAHALPDDQCYPAVLREVCEDVRSAAPCPPAHAPPDCFLVVFESAYRDSCAGAVALPVKPLLRWMAALTGWPALPPNKCSLGLGICATAFAHCLCFCVRSLRALTLACYPISRAPIVKMCGVYRPHGARKFLQLHHQPHDWPASPGPVPGFKHANRSQCIAHGPGVGLACAKQHHEMQNTTLLSHPSPSQSKSDRAHEQTPDLPALGSVPHQPDTHTRSMCR